MSTPLKNISKILYPKILSPVSPNFLTVLNNVSKVDRKNKFKKLDFVECEQKVLTPVKIHITEVGEKINPINNKKQDVLINTPNKQKMIRSGLEDEKYFILGQGRFGKVFKALYNDKSVAMKLVQSIGVDHRERNALNFNHPNIVKILEIIENEKGYYSLIIMEYLPNSTNLQNIISNSLISIDCLQYAKDISKGILYCHKNSILHLDIKPSNILVCNNGICKICDFGNSVNITENNIDYEFHGTVHYAAPEILLGKIPTEKADIYSLGVVFWQMKTREVPYQDVDNIECVIYKVVKTNLRPDLKKPMDIYSNLYQKCWDENPQKRPNVSDILQILSNI